MPCSAAAGVSGFAEATHIAPTIRKGNQPRHRRSTRPAARTSARENKQHRARREDRDGAEELSTQQTAANQAKYPNVL